MTTRKTLAPVVQGELGIGFAVGFPSRWWDLDIRGFLRMTGIMGSRDKREKQRLHRSADKAEAKMKRLEQRREKELAAKDAEIARLEKASEVLARAVVSAYLFSEKHGNG
ncbi:hypothetical protein CYJ16_02520 [Actinotignum timonense]|nr:hypothetical protein CYJ16_02520 [Actinotignum timonense]